MALGETRKAALRDHINISSPESRARECPGGGGSVDIAQPFIQAAWSTTLPPTIFNRRRA